MKDNIEVILDTLTEFFIGLIIIIFPLIVGSKGYFNILEVKYFAFNFISIIYIFSCLLVILYFLIFKGINYFKYLKLRRYHFYLFGFILINIIAVLFSPYKQYDLFLGLGRGEGLLLTLLYTLTFLFISLFGKFEKRYFSYIGISVILVSLIAIIQYFGFNIFNIYPPNHGTYNMSFMTTIGNKDFLSAYYTITLSIICSCFIFLDNKKHENIIYIISLFLGIFIFGVINVDSGLVAFVLSALIMVPFILSKSKFLSKTMIVGSLVILAYAANYILNPVYRYSTDVLKLEPQFNFIMFLSLVVSLLFIFSYFYIKSHYFEVDNKKFIKYYFISIPIFIILVLGVIYFYDFNISLLSDIQSILHGNFDDSLGTYRMFLWKRSISLVKDYPLIGTGPDTFAYRFMNKYLIDVIKLDGTITINDTAGNVYLTMLVNIGILGLISYLGWLISLLKSLFKKFKNTNYLYLVMFIGIICYMFQDMFNLSVVVVTPVFYVILGIAANVIDFKKV